MIKRLLLGPEAWGLALAGPARNRSAEKRLAKSGGAIKIKGAISTLGVAFAVCAQLLSKQWCFLFKVLAVQCGF